MRHQPRRPCLRCRALIKLADEHVAAALDVDRIDIVEEAAGSVFSLGGIRASKDDDKLQGTPGLGANEVGGIVAPLQRTSLKKSGLSRYHSRLLCTGLDI